MSRKAFPQGVTSVVCAGALGRSTSAAQSSIRVNLRHAEEFNGLWHKLNFKATRSHFQGSAGLLGWEFSCGVVKGRSSAGGQWGRWDWSGCGKRGLFWVVLPKRGGLIAARVVVAA